MAGQLSGIQKAAVVLMQLDPQTAAGVLGQLSEQEAQDIAAEIVRLRRIDLVTAEAAIEDFQRIGETVAVAPRGGSEVADALLRGAYGAERAQGVMERIATITGGAAFDGLDEVPAAELGALLAEELPQTIAVVLAGIEPERASAVLAVLGSRIRAAVAQAIATMGEPRPEAVEVIATELRDRASSPRQSGPRAAAAGGLDPLVDIITLSTAETEKSVLAELDDVDPVLGEQLRSRLVGVEDIVRFEDRDVQQVLRGIDLAALATALVGLSPEAEAKIRQNLSEKNRELLDDAASVLGKVKQTQVDQSREPLVRALRELAKAGALDGDPEPGE